MKYVKYRFSSRVILSHNFQVFIRIIKLDGIKLWVQWNVIIRIVKNTEWIWRYDNDITKRQAYM